MKQKKLIDGSKMMDDRKLAVIKCKLRHAAFLMITILTHPFIVYASGGETHWNLTMMLITTWIPRLGGVMLFSGAIEYAIAYQSDNAGQKTQAMRLMVSAGMIIGVSWSIRSLIYV